MNLGTGIFLSTLLLSIVLLVIFTRDKWNWKKILLWTLGTPIVIGLLWGGGYWAYLKYQNRPRKINEYWDIKFGMTREDVKFIKGAPKYEDSESLIYETYSSTHEILFSTSTKKAWLIFCTAGSCDDLLGIGTWDTTEKLEKKLGDPSKIVVSKDGFKRTYFYNDYNVIFELRENRVKEIGIRDVDNLPSKQKS